MKTIVDELDVDELKNEPSGLNSLNSKVDKLDINKLGSAPIDLKKKDLVEKEFENKTVYNELVENVTPLIVLDLYKNRLWC